MDFVFDNSDTVRNGSYVTEEKEEEEEGEDEKNEEDEEGGKGKGEEDNMLPLPKRPRNQTVDRISSLHDSVLLHILSFLPTEDVVRTGLLAKRWQYLWTNISTLAFKTKEIDLNGIHKFVAFVNRVLILCRCSNLKKFVLDFCFFRPEYFPEMDANLWIQFATQHNVEDLYLHNQGFPLVHRLPQILFTNSSLRIFSASNCVIVPGGEISWRSLKSLTMDDVVVSDGVIEKILTSCPILEFLKLSMFSGPSRLSINSASLENVVIQHSMSDQYVLEISAPKLLMLELMGDFERQKFQFANISSLVRVNLKFSGRVCSDEYDQEKRRTQLIELLERLQHVNQLELWDWCIQVLSYGELKGLPSLVSSCKILTLNSHVLKWDIPGIVSLLQGSPYLEKLVVTMSSDYHHAQVDCVLLKSEAWATIENSWEFRRVSYPVSRLHFEEKGRLWVGLRSCCLEVGIGADVVVLSTGVRSGVVVFPVSYPGSFLMCSVRLASKL
ncbi:hypothetical protein RHGRI_037502 [Rhododendron griersonianum]|uniref:F-box domain-containing protein n=1 Tax=Rhododendron griersonianum TaxID=479676 RepID=A0AAV6HXD9_9ERIC|nr:hypothetical protein RHGRI_037502 [Rhododendron griersonianum]